MNVLRRLALFLAMASVLLSGIISYKVLAQSQKLYKWMEEEAKLPPDVHPDTLSRMPRPKRAISPPMTKKSVSIESCIATLPRTKCGGSAPRAHVS